MTMKATKLAAIFSRLHSAWRLPQATLALALAIAAFASPARATEGDLPEEYTALDGGLYKAAADNKILITDYWPNSNTWMEVELKFTNGSGGYDSTPGVSPPDWRYTLFIGHCDLSLGAGHGCIARYPLVNYGDPWPVAMHFFWANGDVYTPKGSQADLPIPGNDATITLRLENGRLTEFNASGAQVGQVTDAALCARAPGKADGPLALFGFTLSISAFSYHSHDMTVYSWKIYESANGKTGDVSTLVRDYRPAEKGGQQGLYDVVEGNFFKLSDVSSSNMTIDFNGGTCAALSTFGMQDGVWVPVIPNEALPEFPAGALPTKSGKVLAGFYDGQKSDSIDGKTMYYTGDGKAQLKCGDNPPTLHAVWLDWTYKINYDLKGGSYPAENPVESATADQAVRVIAPVRNGYRFTGWKVTGFESGAKYALSKGGTENDVGSAIVPCAADGSVWFKNLCSQSLTGADTVTLTAQWENMSWTGGDYDPANWTPNPRNILQGKETTVEGMGLGTFTTTGGAACLTDGVIPGTADATKIAALKGSGDTTLTWSFDGVASVESLTIFTYASGQWGQSVISVKKLEVQHCGSDKWETVKGDAWTYFGAADIYTKKGTLSSLSGGKLFENAAKMRLTLTAPVAYNGSDAFYSTMAEIEAVGTVEPLRQWVRFTITKKSTSTDALCSLGQFGVFDTYGNCLNLNLSRNITLVPPTGSWTIYRNKEDTTTKYKTPASALAPGEFAYYAAQFNMSETEKSVNLFKDDLTKWESTDITNLAAGDQEANKKYHQEFTLRLPDNLAPIAKYDLRMPSDLGTQIDTLRNRAPVSWTVETSSDGINWHLFDERNDFDVSAKEKGEWYFGDDHNNNISWFTKLANFAGSKIDDPNATGGDYIYKVGNDYVHVFTNKTAAQTFHVKSACQAKVLVIARGGNGGAGGNFQAGGGGGAGGYIEESCEMPSGDYTVTVCNGDGNATIASSTVNYLAHAGGNGAVYIDGNPQDGGSGGSGGGGYGWNSGTGITSGGDSKAIDPERGHAGCDGIYSSCGGGGGGGAGSVGSGSNGGLGAFSSITGFDSWYCGGGGGGVGVSGSMGTGQSGGGDGAYITGVNATSATTPGSGGGGGFKWYGTGSGMQGIVVIRVMDTSTLTGVTLDKTSMLRTATGWNTEPQILSVKAGTVEVPSDGYTATWDKSITGAGVYTLTVTGNSPYTGTVTATYTVSKEQIVLPTEVTTPGTGKTLEIWNFLPSGISGYVTQATGGGCQNVGPGTFTAWLKVKDSYSETHEIVGAVDGRKSVSWRITETQITVNLNDNNGSGGSGSVQPILGKDMPTPIQIPTRSGYEFTGYFTQTSGGTKYYNAGGTSAKKCDLTNGATLYAQWEVDLPSEYTELPHLDNGTTLATAGFVCVDGFRLEPDHVVYTKYEFTTDPAADDWGTVFMSMVYESGGGYLRYGVARSGGTISPGVAFSYGIKPTPSSEDGFVHMDNAGSKDVHEIVCSKDGISEIVSGTPTVPIKGNIGTIAQGSLHDWFFIMARPPESKVCDESPYTAAGDLCAPGYLNLYYLRVERSKDDPTEVLHLVPAKRKSDNVKGLYDIIGRKFHPFRTPCGKATEPDKHAVGEWASRDAGEAACGSECGLCTNCLMRIRKMTLPTQPTRSWPYDGANHKPTIANTNDCGCSCAPDGYAGCTVTYLPVDEWKEVSDGYKATYALTPGHVWSDGTTEAKTISYSIVSEKGADFYVTADADGSGNGSSWASPFTFQEALNAVGGAAKDVTNTIYMKVGTYKNPSGPWTATINPCFIRILGGYTGVNLARSQTEYTVLDGENAHGLVNLTVRRGSSTGSKSILFDQIEFRNGQGAYRIKNNDRYNYWSQFNHCRFIDNFVPAGDTTTRGSAIEVVKGSGYSNGTMMSWVCVENCEFRGNKSCSDSATTIYSADKVGDSYAGIKLSHSLFVGNSSKVLPCVAQFGGSKDNNVTIESCTFAYNAAATKANRNDSNGGTAAGGGVVLDEIDTNGLIWKVSNTIFFGNRCKEKEDEDEDAREYWVTNPKGNPKPTYLLYEKKAGYEWCFGDQGDPVTCHYMVGDPMFVTPQPTVTFDTTSYMPTWSVDPSAMDVHLKSVMGRWNGSDWVNDSVTSPAIDAGDPTSDYAAEPSPNGARINLGAYGNTAEASKSLAPIMVTAPDVVGYEGSPTQITVKVTAPATGYTITYSATEDGEYTATNPRYSEFGVYRVYWKVTAANYEEAKGSSLVSIAKKAAGKYVRLTVTKRKGGGTDNDLQFSELALYGDVSGTDRIGSGLALATGFTDLTNRCGTCYLFPTNCYGAQNANKLFDGIYGSASKLCCPRNGTSTDKADAHIQIYMHLSAADAAKVIRSYDLQSGDDVETQGRDARSPTAWRLEVSSDCERWTIIDEKTVADTAGNVALTTSGKWYGKDGSGSKKPYPINLNYVPMEVLETNPCEEGTDAYKAVANYIQIVGFRLEADDVVTAKVRYNDDPESDPSKRYWDTIFSQRDSSGGSMFSVYRRFGGMDTHCVRFDYGDRTRESKNFFPVGECEFIASPSGLKVNGAEVELEGTMGTWRSTPDNSLLLFISDNYSNLDGVPCGNQAYLKCYYFQVADSTAAGSPLRLDLVPASNTVSHAQGLYDRVSGNFYPLQDATKAGKTTLSGSNTKVTFSKELTAIKDETAGWNEFPLVTEVTNRVGYLTSITNYWQQEWVPAAVTGAGEYRLVMRGQGPYKGAVTNFYTVSGYVTLDPNGGTPGATNRVLALPGQPMPAITGEGALPTLAGHAFLGYGDKQWEARLMTGSESDICNEGTTVFAKMVTSDKSSKSLNEVTFDGDLSGTFDKMELGGNGSWTVELKQYEDQGRSDPYGSLMKGGIFRDASGVDTTSTTVTLYGLTPGNSYLFQFFVHDGRTGSNSGGDRTVSVDQETWYRYGLYNHASDATRGAYGVTFICRFVATGETEDVEVYFGKSDKCASAQFNAVQLRDITVTDPQKYYNADGTSATNYPAANGPTKLFAIWAPKTTTITFNGNGGNTGGTTTLTATYGQPLPDMHLPLPTRTGWTFAGCKAQDPVVEYYNAQGKGTKPWDREAFNETLYVQWGPINYTVQIDANGGTGGTSTFNTSYDTVPQVSAPTRMGFSFAGWKVTGVDGTSAKCGASSGAVTTSVTEGGVYGGGAATYYFKNLRETAGTVTLTAQWIVDLAQAKVLTTAVPITPWPPAVTVEVGDGSGTRVSTGFTVTSDPATPTVGGSCTLTLTGDGVTCTGVKVVTVHVNPAAPEIVDTAAMWFDAADAAKLTLSTEAITTDEAALGAGVTFVSDWAKNLGGVDHMSALTKTGDNKRKGNRPYLGTMDNGNHYVDFGSVYNLSKAEPMKSGYGAGFGWFDENGAVTNKTGIMDVYMVVMDDAGCNARYSGSCQYQHFLGSSSDAAGSSSFYRLKDYGYIFIDKYIGASTADAFIDGIISVDGKEVDCRTLYPSGFHVLRFASSGKAGDASALCSNKLDAQGGLKYGELIVFDEVQSDANATAIIDYLYRKWLGDAPKNDILIQFDNGEDASEKLTNGFLMARHAVRTQDIPIKYIDSSVVGYTFQGYFETPTGGTQYYNYDGTPCDDTNATCPFEADTTVYAVWTGNVYTVTLDADGGSGGTPAVRASYGSPMPAATMPTKAGFEFDGYYYDGWYVTQMLGLKADVVKDGTLKYAYAPEATTVNGVAFTATLAGGVTTMGSLGVDVAFDGTDDSCKGEGEDHAYQLLMTNRIYVASGESALTRTLALGGLTAGKSYLVQVIAHKNQGTAPKLSVDSSAEYSLTQFGWSFVRRFVAASSTQEVVLRAPAGSDLMFNAIQVRELGDARYYDETGASAQSWNMAKDTTLKAHWMERYEITYDGLEGATHENPEQYTAKSEIVLRAPTKRDGYVFGGWQEDGTPISYIPKNTMGNKTLTATWVDTNDFMAVEYIATTNCQYLDTGVTPRNAHFGFALDFWDQCYLDKTRQTGEYYNDRAIIGSTGLNGVGFAICNYNSGGTLQGEFTFFNVVTWVQWWWDYTRDFDPLLRGDVRLRMAMLNDLTGEAYATGGKTRKDDEAYSKYTLEQVNGDSTFTPITTAFHKLKTGDGQDPYQDMPEWFLGPIAVGGAYMIEGNVTNFTRYARGVGGGDANNHFMRFYRVTFYHDDIVIYDAIPVIQKSTGHRGLLRVDGTVGNVFAYSGTQYDGVTNAYEQVRTGGFGATKEEMAAMPLGINEFKTPLLDLEAILSEDEFTLKLNDVADVKGSVLAAMRTNLNAHAATSNANFTVLYDVSGDGTATLDESAVINASLAEDVDTLKGWSVNPPAVAAFPATVRCAVLTAVTKPCVRELTFTKRSMYHVINLDGPMIEVDEAWLTGVYGEQDETVYQAKLFETNAHGMASWQSYLLGFEGNAAAVAAATARLATEQNGDPLMMRVKLVGMPAIDDGRTNAANCRIAYRLAGGQTPEEAQSSAEVLEEKSEPVFDTPLGVLDDSPVHYYVIRIRFIFVTGGGKCVYEHAGAVNAGEDGWVANGGGLKREGISLEDAKPGDYLRVAYKATAKFHYGIQTFGFKDGAGISFNEFSDSVYKTDEDWAYCRPYRIPDGAVEAYVMFYPSAQGAPDDMTSFAVKDVRMTLVSEAEACADADAIFGQLDEDAFDLALSEGLPARGVLETNATKLRDALVSGTPYRLLALASPQDVLLRDGLLEEQIRRAIPGSKLTIDCYYNNNDTAGTHKAALDGGKYDPTAYDGVAFFDSCYYRSESGGSGSKQKDVEANLPALVDALRAKKPGLEIIFISPLYSCESRFGSYYYWDCCKPDPVQDATGGVYYHMDDTPVVKTTYRTDSDWWAGTMHPIAMRTSLQSMSVSKSFGYWELYDIAYDYLWRSGHQYGWLNRGRGAGYMPNERGNQLNIRILVEALKRLAGR